MAANILPTGDRVEVVGTCYLSSLEWKLPNAGSKVSLVFDLSQAALKNRGLFFLEMRVQTGKFCIRHLFVIQPDYLGLREKKCMLELVLRGVTQFMYSISMTHIIAGSESFTVLNVFSLTARGGSGNASSLISFLRQNMTQN